MKPILVRTVLALTLPAMLLTGTGVASAGIVATTDAVAIESGAARVEQLERVQRFLARDDVRDRLVAWGVDPAEAATRAAALTDVELAGLADRLDDAPAGGILAIIGAVFVVLLLLDYLGVTKVFRRTR